MNSAAADGDIHISSADAEIIRKLMEEFFLRHQLSQDETAAMHSLCRALGVGRPVPEHGSGP